MHLLPEPVRRYSKYIPTIALCAGLVLDIVTLNRPDALFENVVILSYLAISAFAITALQARWHRENETWRLTFLSILQFTFGNLASALMVLYSRSGTFTGSAIFIIFLASLLLGNELLKKRYSRTHLRISIWFILLLTYSALAVPILLNSIAIPVFLVSVASALGVFWIFATLLSYLARKTFAEHISKVAVSISTITILFCALYFTHMIPPVPLALKHIGIYHSVIRSNDVYTLTYEHAPWYAFWRDTHAVFSLPEDTTSGYCFTSVFAPNKLKTEIRHVWERYDAHSETWVAVARIPFTISGGREGGFRGYTQTTQLNPGRWRCRAETQRGVLIGQTVFDIVQQQPEVLLERSL